MSSFVLGSVSGPCLEQILVRAWTMVMLGTVTELKRKLIQLRETAPVMIDDRDAEASRHIDT
jgi:hypothetical protein